VLSKNRYASCYDKAMRIRRVVKERFDEVLSRVDCLIMPACSKAAYRPQDVGASLETVYAERLFTCAANMTGMPALTVAGIQLMAGTLQENKLFAAAAEYERGAAK
jgi:aspartyl-tRNA(Asn)/glutamyl-tRNA(Gln) amidotransferase subunit A